MSRVDVDKENRRAELARSCLTLCIKIGLVFIIWAITIYVTFCFLIWRQV